MTFIQNNQTDSSVSQLCSALKFPRSTYYKALVRVPSNKVNILKRDFGTETINQKWGTDITYIHVKEEGWTYLASVMDLCSRKIIGYAYGTSMTADLAVRAVKNACLNVRDTEGIILPSKGILHSYSRKRNPYDNACIESFHSLLKKEEIYPTRIQRKPAGQFLNT